jgi:hypothetical protein
MGRCNLLGGLHRPFCLPCYSSGWLLTTQLRQRCSASARIVDSAGGGGALAGESAPPRPFAPVRRQGLC